MASIKLYLDTRKRNEDELCPLSIIISHRNRTAHLATGVKVLRTDIDMTKTPCRVIRGNNKQTLNQVISTKYMQAQRCLLELTEKRLLDDMSVADIKLFIEYNGDIPVDNNSPSDTISFRDKFLAYIDSRIAPNSRRRYQQTYNNISQFCNIDTLAYDDITPLWLTRFDRFLTDKGQCMNTRAIQLRNIRCVLNQAIADEDTNARYPFKKFRIKTEPTKNRNLSAEQLRHLIGLDNLSPKCLYYRDIFVISFLLIGTNTTDLYNLKYEDIDNGRLYYIRAKTQKKYSILIPDEVKPYLERHKGKDYLLDLHETNPNIERLTANSSFYLKSIHENLSMYWARHTWATIAYQLGISVDVIALALGHTMGNKTTAIYINPDIKKVDEANRKVIDFVLHNK